MSGMIERVAQAICTAEGGYDFNGYLEAARAAIEALRVPTEGMLGVILSSGDWDEIINEALGLREVPIARPEDLKQGAIGGRGF